MSLKRSLNSHALQVQLEATRGRLKKVSYFYGFYAFLRDEGVFYRFYGGILYYICDLKLARDLDAVYLGVNGPPKWSNDKMTANSVCFTIVFNATFTLCRSSLVSL